MFSIVSISFALSFAGVHTHTLNVNFYSDHCGLAAILYLHNSVQIVCCVQIINCQSTWVKRTIVCLFSRYNMDLKATVKLRVTFHICKKNQQLCFSWTRTSWESGLHCGSCGGCRMAHRQSLHSNARKQERCATQWHSCTDVSNDCLSSCELLD